MVLKKPYAFLIKNFRIIHIILTAIIVFIIYRYNKIAGFFSSYVKGEVKNALGFAETYIGPLIYIAVIVVIIFAFAMLWLMQKKEKPTLFYILAFGFYLVMLIAIIVANGVMNSLAESILTQQASRTYRDFFFILQFPQYYFVIMSLIRALGFDVKKFNFNKDLDELEIKSEDNEEFEFVLGTDIYVYERKIRRTLREMKYYVLENKLIISIVGGVASVGLIIYLFMNVSFINKVYKTGQNANLAGFTYRLNSSYVTAYDYNGNLIKKGKQYLILNITITNNGSNPVAIENHALFLNNGKNSLYHQPSLRNYFIDVGKAYIKELLTPNVSKDLVFIFELNDQDNYKKYVLKLLRESGLNEDNQVQHFYSDYKLKPKNVNAVPSRVEANTNGILYLGEALFQESNLNISKIELMTKYEYQYELCKDSKCKTYYNVISPTDAINQKLLVITYKLEMNQNIGFIDSMSTEQFFFDKFLYVEYNYSGKQFSQALSTKTYPSLKGKVFIDLPKAAISKDLFNLLIKTREYNYYINLLDI